MIEVQIKTPLPPNCTMGMVKKIVDSASVKVSGISKFDSGVRGLLELKAKELKDAISCLPPSCEALVLSNQEAKVLIKEHACYLALAILDAGCLITSAELDEDSVTWNLICDDESFKKLMRSLEEYGVEFDLLYKGKPGSKSSITYREEEILKIALKKGYFDYPKKIKLEELASLLDIAPSTLSEILRRGQKKVLEKYFSEKQG